MSAWLAFYAGLAATSWAIVWPMLRMPPLFVPPRVIASMPNATFDYGGLT